jgi:hypothetical protein
MELVKININEVSPQPSFRTRRLISLPSTPPSPMFSAELTLLAEDDNDEQYSHVGDIEDDSEDFTNSSDDTLTDLDLLMDKLTSLSLQDLSSESLLTTPVHRVSSESGNAEGGGLWQ